MPIIEQLLQLIQLGNWFTAIDLKNATVTALTLMQPLGLMSAAHPVVPLGLLHMYRWQRSAAFTRTPGGTSDA